MKRLKLAPGERALVVAAHPDDETIWMGGTILMNPKIRWTIFCLSRSSDKDRCPKFYQVCRIYGAQAIITDLEDEGRMSAAATIPVIKRLLTRKLKGKKFDYLFTHGENGEYGHERHLGAHQAVKSWRPQDKLGVKEILAFNYAPAAKESRPSMMAKKNSDYIVPLPKAVFNKKKKIQAEVYGYDPNGIDVGLCPNPEAFKNI